MNKETWDLDRFTDELALAAEKLKEMSVGEQPQTAMIRAVIAHFPVQQRTVAFNCFQTGYDATTIRLRSLEHEHEITKMTQRTESRRETRAFWTGGGLLVLSVAVSLFFDSKDKSAVLGLRLMAGVGVGLMIAYLPGFFSLNANVNQPGLKVAIRATGALAALVMVYLFDPGWFSSLLSH